MYGHMWQGGGGQEANDSSTHLHTPEERIPLTFPQLGQKEVLRESQMCAMRKGRLAGYE